ncbi:hypothetical protein HMPREF1141_0468 [Clostridium sp. MSTE9]|nr:hypothetical protein HMPREF1141_0468 [Clostridium sp. MSTE9]
MGHPLHFSEFIEQYIKEQQGHPHSGVPLLFFLYVNVEKFDSKVA